MSDSSSARHPLEVLAAEFVERYRRGEKPSLTEYTARHPDLAQRIHSLFPTVRMMEDLKRGRGPAALPGVPTRIPERMGEFRIVREVGRGGMGIVYEAEQESLGRHVAVKVLTAQALLDADQLRRFHREAQTMARLHHTNIVPLFGVGEHEGMPYLVMQFIDGRGLDEVVASGVFHVAGTDQLPLATRWQQAASLGLQVAEALRYAHAQGTVHRDIKPSNLLLDGRGTVWITDFGLACMVEHDDLTRSGETSGTLRYMAPERFHGQSDARGDIYSLGLTLYELLALRPAFAETDRGQLVRRVMEEEPLPPRKHDPAIPRDLETIVLRAIARDPAHRYRSAGELADDLRRFLEDKPVLARRTNPVARLWRCCRRNPAIASLTAVAVCLLLVAALVASVAYVQTSAALDREAALRQQAEEHRSQAEANLELVRTAIARETEQHLEAIGQRKMRGGKPRAGPARSRRSSPRPPGATSFAVVAIPVSGRMRLSRPSRPSRRRSWPHCCRICSSFTTSSANATSRIRDCSGRLRGPIAVSATSSSGWASSRARIGLSARSAFTRSLPAPPHRRATTAARPPPSTTSWA